MSRVISDQSISDQEEASEGLGTTRDASLHELERLMGSIKPHHPINRLQCGSWVQEYAAMHRDLMAGSVAGARPRLAVMVSRAEWENGIADRIASSLSVLLYAILTRRAFLYEWGEELVAPLWAGLRSDFIDWRAPSGWREGRESSKITLDYVAERNNESEFLSFFQHDDLTSLWEKFETVVFHTDHSHVHAAFDNPHLIKALSSLGFQRETAFACLFDFLYRPTRETVNAVKSQLPSLLSNEYIKIGIQIRVGDWQLISSSRYWFHPQDHAFLFEHYFDCAKQIEIEVLSRYTDPRILAHKRLEYRFQKQEANRKQNHSISSRGVKPLLGTAWYILTDVGSLRRQFLKRYGRLGSAVLPGWRRKLVVNADADLKHIVKDKGSSLDDFYTALGELWSFSLLDHHILTRNSGFGKVGSMVAVKEGGYQGTTFTINYPMQLWRFLGMGGPAFDNRKRFSIWQWTPSCRSSTAKSLRELCFDFTGC